MATREEYEQLKDYARIDGAIVGGLWILSFAMFYRRILQPPVRLRFIIHRRFLFGFRGDAPAPLPRHGLGRHHFIPPRNALQHAHILLRRPVDGCGAVHILPVHRPRLHAFTIRGNHQHARIQDDAVGLWHETGRHEAGNGQHRSAAPY